VVVELVAHLGLELAPQAFELGPEIFEVGLHDGCGCFAQACFPRAHSV
jgi:hypothetical protein